MELPTFLLILLSLIALVRYLRWRLDEKPPNRWRYFLFGNQVRRQPAWLHVDVPRMSKKQLLGAGLRALTWGLSSLSVAVVSAMLIGALFERNQAPPLFVLPVIVGVFGSALGTGAGLYLLVRGVFRRRSNSPQGVKP